MSSTLYRGMRPCGRVIVVWAIVVGLAAEAVTVWLRFGAGLSADEFSRTAPLVLQVHHMFWSVPLIAAALLVRHKPALCGAHWGIAAGLIASDLVHHFLVLPLAVGNTGWHWP